MSVHRFPAAFTPAAFSLAAIIVCLLAGCSGGTDDPATSGRSTPGAPSATSAQSPATSGEPSTSGKPSASGKPSPSGKPSTRGKPSAAGKPPASSGKPPAAGANGSATPRPPTPQASGGSTPNAGQAAEGSWVTNWCTVAPGMSRGEAMELMGEPTGSFLDADVPRVEWIKGPASFIGYLNADEVTFRRLQMDTSRLSAADRTRLKCAASRP